MILRMFKTWTKHRMDNERQVFSVPSSSPNPNRKVLTPECRCFIILIRRLGISTTYWKQFIFWGPSFCLSHWNMECRRSRCLLRGWNIGILILKGSFSPIIFTNFPVKMYFTKNPMMHFPGTHYSIIPVFQHSNWGVASKFDFPLR